MKVKNKTPQFPTQQVEPGPALPPQPPVQAPATEIHVEDQPLAEQLSSLLNARASAFAQRDGEPPAEGAKDSLAVRAEALAGPPSPAKDRAEAGLDGTRGSVNSAFLWNSTPGEAGTGEAPSKAFDASVDGRDIGTTTRFSSGATPGGLGVSMDRLGVGVDATLHSPGEDRYAGIWAMKGWGMGWVGRTRDHADGSADSIDFGPYFDATSGGLYASLRHTFASGTTIRYGGFAGGAATRELRDLGPYSGDDAALQGTRAVELNRSLDGDLTLTPGMALGAAFGIGGRLGVAKGKRVQYRTHLAPDEAHTQLFAGGGKLGKWARGRCLALGLKDEPLPPPDLARPEALKAGDKVTLQTSGSFSGGLVLGPGFGAFIGGQGAMQGEFQLSVEKSDPDHVTVEVVPSKVNTLQISGRAIVLDVTAARHRARAMAQAFRFDLREPAARAAYAALLQGELPGGGDAKVVDKGDAERPPTVEVALPAGVERGPVERYSARATSTHADVGFLLALAGTTRTRGSSERTVDAGDVQLRESTRQVEKAYTVPLSGDEQRGVRASLLRATRFEDGKPVEKRFHGLRLVAYHQDSKARGLELNDDIDDFNAAFGLELGHFHNKALKQARGIELQMNLGAEDLEALAKIPDLALREAARAAGTRTSGLLTLARELQGSSDVEARAGMVQDYLARSGFEGMGALVRLLGVDRVALSTTVGARDALFDEARSMAFKYAAPIAADADNKQLATRFKEIHKLDAKLVKLKDLLYDDPLLKDADKQTALQEARDAQQALQDCLATRHLGPAQRQRLIDQLHRGWTTGWEYKAIAALEHPDGNGV